MGAAESKLAFHHAVKPEQCLAPTTMAHFFYILLDTQQNVQQSPGVCQWLCVAGMRRAAPRTGSCSPPAAHGFQGDPGLAAARFALAPCTPLQLSIVAT